MWAGCRGCRDVGDAGDAGDEAGMYGMYGCAGCTRMSRRLALRPPGPMLLQLCPFSCGEPAAGATAKFVTLLPDAGFLLFAEAASKALPSFVRARLYVHVEQNTCEVTCDETLRGAIALADALAPERKARSSAALCLHAV